MYDLLLAYLAALVLGAWCVSEGGDILGDKYDASILGGFVIAWLNTLPETIFFITALETNKVRFAVGAMSGSVIVVSTIALGACIYYGARARDSNKIFILDEVRKQAQVLGGSLGVVVLIAIFHFNYFLGVVGCLEYLGFIVYSLWNKASETQEPSHSKDFDIEAGDPEHDDDEEQPTWKGFAYLGAGGVLIWFCSEPFIEVVVMTGEQWNVNSLLLAFFFAPVASEAPEILESISLSRKGKTQNINIAFSNLIGGTVSKTTLLLGILCLYGSANDFAWESPGFTVSILLLVVCAGAAAALGMLFQELDGKYGKMLILLFIAVGVFQLVVATQYGVEVGALLENEDLAARAEIGAGK